MRNAEEEALRANIASLGDQLEELSEAEGREPGLEPVELEPGLILDKLEAEEELLTPAEIDALEAFTEGAGDVVSDLVDRIKAGGEISAEEIELLRAAIGGAGAEVEEGEAEAIAKSIIARSLAGVNRQDVFPLLAGIRAPDREAHRLVHKRFDSWADARADGDPDADLIRLFGADDSRVAKDLPRSLEPDEEEDEVLQRAVAKMQAGEPLTEEEMAEALAANLAGQPFAPLAGVTLSGAAHKALIPFNRTRPVESLQETAREVRRMIFGEREDIVLNRQGRGGKRKELVRKSLGAAVNALLGQRQ